MIFDKNSISNISFQLVTQVISLGLPLIAIPLLLNVVSLSEFGFIAIIQSIYFTSTSIVEYSYNISGPKLLAGKDNISNDLSVIVFSKFLVSIFLSPFLVFFIVFYDVDIYISFILMISVVVSAFDISFVFHLRQQGKILFLSDFPFKFLFLILVVLLYYSNNLNTTSYMVSNLLFLTCSIALRFFILPDSIYIIKSISPGLLKKSLLSLRSGSDLFLSKLASIFYSHTSIIYFSLFYSTELIGLFAITEKIVRTFISFINPFVNDYNSKVLHSNKSPRAAMFNILFISTSIFILVNLLSSIFKVFFSIEVNNFDEVLFLFSILIVIIPTGLSLSLFYFVKSNLIHPIRTASLISLFVFILVTPILSLANSIYMLFLSVIIAELISVIYKFYKKLKLNI